MFISSTLRHVCCIYWYPVEVQLEEHLQCSIKNLSLIDITTRDLTMLKNTFFELITNYTNDIEIKQKYWKEIALQYADKKRYYHNLTHLENLLVQLTDTKQSIQNWDAILFSLYYHDIIYNTLKSNNEEKSAILAGKRLKELNIGNEIIQLTEECINATKKHQVATNNDINLFTDADLSILGADWETYHLYTINIRKEYSIYPNIIYNSGRTKVIQHFLSMKTIFKTTHFQDKYESNAIANLTNELKLLEKN